MEYRLGVFRWASGSLPRCHVSLFFRVVDLNDEGGGGRVVGESVLPTRLRSSAQR